MSNRNGPDTGGIPPCAIQLVLAFVVENLVCSFRHTQTWIDLQLLNATALVGWVSELGGGIRVRALSPHR